MTKNRSAAYIALLINVVIWGAALPIVKPALSLITPYYFLLLRYLVASIFLLPVLYAFWPPHFTFKRFWLIMGIESVQLLLSLNLLYLGLANTSALTASLMGTIAPVFTTLAGIYILKEKEDRHEWLGLALSLLGSVTLIITSSVAPHPVSSSGLGVIYLFGYLLANTAYLVLAKKYYRHENKVIVTCLSSLLGLVSFLVLAPLLGPTLPLTSLSGQLPVLRAVLYMGILGTPLAMSLLLYGQSHIETSEASLFTYLQPLVYLPLTVLWLGETITLWQIVGLIIIGFGVFVAEQRRRSPRRRDS